MADTPEALEYQRIRDELDRQGFFILYPPKMPEEHVCVFLLEMDSALRVVQLIKQMSPVNNVRLFLTDATGDNVKYAEIRGSKK